MGGPWRARGYDPAGWQPPRPRAGVTQPAGPVAREHLNSFVIAYIALVATSIVILVALLEAGW